MDKPNIVVFMSDQHTPSFSSYEGGSARTPNLEKLCRDGTSFSAAYTSCPLCVPARVSMLMGKIPSRTGVFDNEGAIPDPSATFLHSLVAAGYETVLIGRMHFIGRNQRHGFTKRLVGDMTPVSWNRPFEKIAAERGVHKGFAEPWCLNVIGGGDSPVLEFDKEVIRKALDYLKEEHEKPQCIFVSTYGPHFPYVAPVEKYLYYKDKVTVPDTFRKIPDYLNPVLAGTVIQTSEETVKKARAAYYGMIETIDEQLGMIRSAFTEYTEKDGREGIFAYISDHGDQCGEKRMFGKNTFFEASARIPFIIQGSNVMKGNRIPNPVSIMDLGPTLCEYAGVLPPPGQDGESLVSNIAGINMNEDRAVLSELISAFHSGKAPGSMEEAIKKFSAEKTEGREKPAVIARMVRKGRYKFITYVGYEEYDLLFDLDADPEEKSNIAADHTALVDELKGIALKGWDPQTVLQSYKDYTKTIQLVKAWERAVGLDDTERWKENPEYARIMPSVT